MFVAKSTCRFVQPRPSDPLLSPALSPAVPLCLNTHLNLSLEESRVAGIEFGCLFNQWLKCRFTVSRSILSAGSWRWTASFGADDDGTHQDFIGSAGTKQDARYQALDTLAKRIRVCIESRRRWMVRYDEAQTLSIAAGVPAAQ